MGRSHTTLDIYTAIASKRFLIHRVVPWGGQGVLKVPILHAGDVAECSRIS